MTAAFKHGDAVFMVGRKDSRTSARVVGFHDPWVIVEYYGKTTHTAKRLSRMQTIRRPEELEVAKRELTP